MSYTIIVDILYKQGKDGVLHRFVTSSKIPLILKECHDNMAGGHFVGDVTVRKILQSGYWWPTLFADCIIYTKQCDVCQRIGKPTDSCAMPLPPILALARFEKWGIDSVGPFNPPSRHGRYQRLKPLEKMINTW